MQYLLSFTSDNSTGRREPGHLEDCKLDLTLESFCRVKILRAWSNFLQQSAKLNTCLPIPNVKLLLLNWSQSLVTEVIDIFVSSTRMGWWESYREPLKHFQTKWPLICLKSSIWLVFIFHTNCIYFIISIKPDHSLLMPSPKPQTESVPASSRGNP